jgi:hypothetical protein
MSSIETRLREALTERARHSPVDADAWEQTLARTRRRPRAGVWARYVIPAAAATAVVAIVVGATVLTGRGGRDGGSGGHGSESGRTGTAQLALPAPLSRKDFLIKQDPPVSQVVRVNVSTGQLTQQVYLWYARMKGGRGTVLCSEFRLGKLIVTADCETVQLSAHQAGVLTGDDGAIKVGAVSAQATSVRAQLSGGPAAAGRLVSGRGFPARVWVVSYQPPDAAVIVHGKPQHGGITVFHRNAVTWTAYLVNGQVRFWSGNWMLAFSTLQASGAPDVGVFSEVLTSGPPGSGFYGYAHGDIARVTIRLASGKLLTARTFPGWPGSGIRLWAAPVPSGLRQAPWYVALGYDRAGHVVWQATHG